jgi:tRNA (guanine9-N1)-methyltransferase
MESAERPNKMVKLSHTPTSEEHRTAEAPTAPSNTTELSTLPEISSLLPSEPCTTTSLDPPAHLHREDDLEPSPHSSIDHLSALDPSLTGKTTHPTLSKSALKKLRRKEEWEATRSERIERKKVKAKEKKQRLKDAYASAVAAGLPPPAKGTKRGRAGRAPHHRAEAVPMTFVLDCAFDELMTEGEVVSLAAQVTRCYHEVRHATVQPQLAVSGFSGRLKERFDGIMRAQYKQWKMVKVMEEDCAEVAEMAKGWMQETAAAKEAKSEMLANGTDAARESLTETSSAKDAKDANDAISNAPNPTQDAEPTSEPEIIYLSAESPNTIHTLSPHSTYIIGGLVDRNRHKGICYKTACEKGIRTARLPIGEYVQMSSRKVLTTNHVVEIMLRYLETKDWGKAFVEVIPKRKGGVLKGVGVDVEVDANDEEDEDEDQEVEDFVKQNTEDLEAGEEAEDKSEAEEEKTG